MTHAHFHLPAHAWDAEGLRLTGDEARHCAQVTRHKAGDTVVLFDGAGRKAEARIEVLGKTEVLLTLLGEQQMPPPSHPVTLLQAVTKGDTFERIIEKAVELGVQRIIPVITERTIVRLELREAAKKHQKWQRLVLEACKQCGQAWLPEILMPGTLEAALEHAAGVSTRLVASLHPQAAPLRALWPPAAVMQEATGFAVMIGPEGDLSGREHAQMEAQGWHPWSLGPLVLRSETAAVCALSILSYELHSSTHPPSYAR